MGQYEVNFTPHTKEERVFFTTGIDEPVGKGRKCLSNKVFRTAVPRQEKNGLALSDLRQKCRVSLHVVLDAFDQDDNATEYAIGQAVEQLATEVVPLHFAIAAIFITHTLVKLSQ